MTHCVRASPIWTKIMHNENAQQKFHVHNWKPGTHLIHKQLKWQTHQECCVGHSWFPSPQKNLSGGTLSCSQKEVWVDMSSFRCHECCESHLSWSNVDRAISFACWCLCDKHLVLFSTLITQVRCLSISGDDSVSCSGGGIVRWWCFFFTWFGCLVSGVFVTMSGPFPLFL